MGPIATRDLIVRLRALDFEGPFSGGRHVFMKKGQLKVRVPIPRARVPWLGRVVRRNRPNCMGPTYPR